MTGIANSLVDLASQLLEHEEREIVLGDLAEAGESAWRAFADVLGLVVRRQALLWRNWRPWLATFGVALPASLLLMGFSLTVSRNYQLYAWIIGNHRFIDPKLLQETGLPAGPGVARLVCGVVLLTIWAWTGGFVVGSVSRRTVWASAAVSVLACSFCFARFHNATLSRFCLLLFLLPAIWGVWRGLRIARIKLSSAIVLALAATVFLIPSWRSGSSWILTLLSWPAWYMVMTARRTSNEL
jgi:hypothetical protein